MQKTNRREFLNKTALALTGTLAMPSLLQAMRAAKFLNIPIGFQTFPIRTMLSKDFPGTLKTMADMGYKLVEMCSPKGYAGIGYGAFVSMKASDIKKTINDAGLTCPSCHFTSGELFKDSDLDDRIEFAQQLGLSQMICSTFWLPKTATLKDYQDSAEKLNKAAEKIKKAGMQAGFHNHEFEFAELEGQLIYDVLMKSFDPDLIKMQFQTEVINLGYKASTYFAKYPGRFISSHLSDWTKEKKEVPVGQGVIDWKEYFEASKAGGVKNYFVEMNFENFKDSGTYIHSLA